MAALGVLTVVFCPLPGGAPSPRSKSWLLKPRKNPRGGPVGPDEPSRSCSRSAELPERPSAIVAAAAMLPGARNGNQQTEQ